MKTTRKQTVKEVKWSELTNWQKTVAEAKFTPSANDKKIELFGIASDGDITTMTAKQLMF